MRAFIRFEYGYLGIKFMVLIDVMLDCISACVIRSACRQRPASNCTVRYRNKPVLAASIPLPPTQVVIQPKYSFPLPHP